MAKTHGERIARMEESFISIHEDIEKIEKHLNKLNGSVAENSKFRIQQQTVYWIIGGAWASIFVPLVAIAIALLY